MNKKSLGIVFLLVSLCLTSACSDFSWSDIEISDINLPKKVIDINDIPNQEGQLSIDLVGTFHGYKTLEYDKLEAKQFEGYYYSTLSEEGKKVYDELYIIFRDHIDNKKVSSTDQKLIERVGHAVLYDHPELYNVDTFGYRMQSIEDEVIAIVPYGTYLYEDVSDRDKNVENYLRTVIGTIPQDATEYDKAKAVFEYIILNTEYVTDCENNQNILSVMENGESVCSGYAKTYMAVMQKLGFECILVNGQAKESGINHSWNMLKLGGNWYHVDVTWGDASYNSSLMLKQDTTPIGYQYFLVPDEWILKDHVISDEFELPKCSSTAYNYYVMENLLVDSVDTDILEKIFSTAYLSKQKFVTFKATDEKVFNSLKDYLFVNSMIFNFLEGKDGISYTLDDKNYTITVLLKK